MLKEFLNLFRSDDELAEELDHPHLKDFPSGRESDSTYLEFLFERIESRIADRLDEHPDTDPILEVATSVLLEMFPDRWEKSEGALMDRWTPGESANSGAAPPRPPGDAPPPPSPSPPAPPEQTDDEEQPDKDEQQGNDAGEVEPQAEEERSGDDGEPVDEETQPDDESEQFEVVDEEPVTASDESGDGGEILDIEELGGTEQEVVDTGSPAGFVSALDETAEFEPPPARRGSVQGTASLDEPSVLHGARILLAVLLDNDRLPVDEQLSIPEVLMAAELWARLIVRDTDVDDRIKQLARLVEKKFGTNHFSQARLLLKLFPTNQETRLNNDRQLFFEDMISRLGVRDHGVGGSDVGTDEVMQRLQQSKLDEDGPLRQAIADLGEELGVNMHLYTRSPVKVDRWRTLVEQSQRPELVWYFLDKIPPRRWRPVTAEGRRPLETALREHTVRPMVRDYVIDHLQTCYFVLRTVGDTGLEPYLDSFFDWSEQCFDVNALVFLPEIHTRITVDRELIEPVYADIYDRYYREPVQQRLEQFDDEALHDAFTEAMQRVGAANIEAIAEGNFNLGGFVLDAFLGFEYPEPEFAFGMHRLT